ncbi:MAG: alpha/beta hydrolase [Myxococcota bacterium]
MHKEFEIKEVTFDVDGASVVGVLRIPDSARPLPALALAGPLSSVKDQVTGNWGKAMAHRGYMTLSFDHRYYGDSGGKPRQYEYPRHKVADIRAAFGYLAHRTEVNPRRIGALGVCAGAGYMAGAVVKDDRVRSWAAVAGFFHDATKQREWMGQRFDAEIERARQARAHYEQTGEVLTIPAVGEGDVAMPLPEAYQYYGTPRGHTPGYRNEFALMSREHTLTYDAQSLAPRVRIPTLMIHSERALAPDLARSFYAALGGAKEEQWVESNGQIDFYDDPARIEPAADALAWHFRNTM